MPVVTFLNQKGGVGKTSSVHHLAGALAREGGNVLVVDADPQASLTQGLLGPEATFKLDPRETVAAAFSGALSDLTVVSQPTLVAGVEILPGSPTLGEWNAARPFDEPLSQQRCLAEALDLASVAFDWILIDCPPNLHLCSWAALAASTHFVIPTQLEDYGSQGLDPVLTFVAAVKAINPHLAEAGILATRVNRRASLHKLYETRLRENYGTRVFDQVVPQSIVFPEAVAHRRPLSHYAPKHPATAAMAEVAEELSHRVAGINTIPARLLEG